MGWERLVGRAVERARKYHIHVESRRHGGRLRLCVYSNNKKDFLFLIVPYTSMGIIEIYNISLSTRDSVDVCLAFTNEKVYFISNHAKESSAYSQPV